MRANYGDKSMSKLKQETLAIAKRMIEERESEILAQVQTSVLQQTLATAFWILHRDFGWGAERLNRLKNGIEDEFVIMHKAPMNKEYTPLDIRDWLREYGVDLEETQYKGGID